MSDISLSRILTSAELALGRYNSPPVEVEIEVTGLVYCNDPDYGFEARDITAKIIGRDLTEDEIDFLDLEQILCEKAFEDEPTPPKIGDCYLCVDGYTWAVADIVLSWDRNASYYVMLERPRSLLLSLDHPFNPSKTERRVVPLEEFAFSSDDEGKPLFQWTSNKPQEKENVKHV